MPILATKLHIPTTRPDLIPRPRLYQQLDAALGRKLTVISAPAGFGKTTLLSGWLAGCDSPVAWLSLDERDNEIRRMLLHVVAALQTLDAGIGQVVMDALQTSQQLEIEPLLTPLLNDMVALNTDVLLVLDDYHLIENSTIDEALAFLLDYLPAQVHLVIATRKIHNCHSHGYGCAVN